MSLRRGGGGTTRSRGLILTCLLSFLRLSPQRPWRSVCVSPDGAWKMRAYLLAAFFGLAACAGPGAGQSDNVARAGVDSAHAGLSSVPGTSPLSDDGSFGGAWASCEGAATPDECSRYVLVQRGERICGTWSYLASGQAYEGRLAARVISATRARRTRVCGRPGSETDTECDAGWQTIDRPLQLCNGRLSDIASANGSCFADYVASTAAGADIAKLKAQPWLQTCLATDP